ncbi:hypothetical protein H6F50_08685 [Coleofasciculus sp. FACHB-712]|nr:MULTISPECIES: hypothetical protein [unclassified Coleofasciculus]MBD1942432.1 hypothetical protein [Coleofasciculus sp. FACHB-712]
MKPAHHPGLVCVAAVSTAQATRFVLLEKKPKLRSLGMVNGDSKNGN